MLQRLKLKNFRRHEDTELTFDDTSHLTLFAGVNGSGKTSVLEGIRYALYGLGRTNKTKLDNMVRLGAELEGMEAELDFLHNGHEYAIRRRYEDGFSQATIAVNGTVVQQGPREVSKYVAQLFGMDVQGFDSATFATQKQLNGLTSLSAAKRSKTVTRLMRADVFTKARDDARAEMNDKKRLLQQLGEAPDVNVLQGKVEQKQAKLDAAAAAQKAAIAESARLEVELREKSDVQAEFKAASERKARADGRKQAAETALSKAKADLRRLQESQVERPNVPDVGIEELEARYDEVSERLSRAREGERAEADRASLRKEIEDLTAQRDKLDEQIRAHRGSVEATSAVVKAEQEISRVNGEIDTLTSRAQELGQEKAVLEATLKSADDQRGRLESLDASCPTCEQEIPHDHREEQVAAAVERISELQSKLDDTDTEINEINSKITAARDELKTAEGDLSEARKVEQQVADAEREKNQLNRSINVHENRLNALPEAGEPVEPLAEERAQLSADVQAVRAADREMRDWVKHQNNLETAENTVASAEKELESASTELADAEVPQSLADAVDELGVLSSKLAAERELASECSTLAAVAEQHLASAEDELKRANTEVSKRKKLRDEVEKTEASARLLASSAKHMSNRIRPALEGAVGSILGVMSEGRFDAVKVDKDYNIQVKDDGVFNQLGEMSGGEQDLVGLALRLGLARVVASTHGTSGPGFLVLDEIFGSQDAGRRESILSALQALRGTFPQILLVSHIDGAEDKVDTVVRVERIDPDDQGDEPATAMVSIE